ncbi:BglG family transcriptional antiterminator [Enterobacter sp. BIGb0383]|uniref:PRD domain-containing protein n=1 Tax=unclassified Enterobacter TaxID=2608935 RepID=UPI000F47BC73|nr:MULTISPECIES: PRD domain-containing protein [unclassified Enterobacter]ROP48961.1 BglG family transcriptional antiterminator [Enterobacter sp. BIGb0383]ROS00573.1 BglG family transcriptional antiterminator [Enterobacter sp. BIGb0359]
MQLDHQAVTILKKVAAEPGMSIKGLCERIGLAQRHFYYRRSRINDWLMEEGYAPLSCSGQQGVRLQAGETGAILRQLAVLYGHHYKLSAGERRDHLLLHLTCNATPLFTQQLSEINHVSRNTTLEDLHLLKRFLLDKHALTLTVGKKQGYHIEGSRLALRLCVQQLLQRNLKYSDTQTETRIAHVIQGYLSGCGMAADRTQRAIEQGLQLIEHSRGRTFTDKDKRLLHYMLMFSLLDALRGSHIHFSAQQTGFLSEQPECETAALLNRHLATALSVPAFFDNTLFFCLLLSTSKRLHASPTGSTEDRRLVGVIQAMITQFQALSGIYLADVSRLVARLFAHLGPAIHRSLFGIQHENVLRDEVSQRYPLIFRLCRQTIVTLEQEYRIVVNDDELSYIAVSFAAWLDRRPETGEQQVLLLTEGGLSSTAILENQLRNLTVVPLEIVPCSVSQLEQQGIPAQTRLIVSTIPLQGERPDAVPFIQVQHMLTSADRQQIRLMLENPGGIGDSRELVQALVAAVGHYAPEAKAELEQTFSAIVGHFMESERLAPLPLTLADYLHQRIQFCGRQLSWRQAIRTAVQPLVGEGVVSHHYGERIIRHIEKSGVTTYLTPQVLLLHAAPPAGTSTGALSLLKMKRPLDFGRFAANLSPLLIIILVPSHDLSHIAILDALNRLTGNESALFTLLQASSLSAVQTCIETCWP